jgi:hypothetical protein
VDWVYPLLSVMGHAIGVDRCANMSTPAEYTAIAVVVVAGILAIANAAIILASLTNHKDIAKRIMRVFSHVVWVFRIGGGDGYESDHRRA